MEFATLKASSRQILDLKRLEGKGKRMAKFLTRMVDFQNPMVSFPTLLVTFPTPRPRYQ